MCMIFIYKAKTLENNEKEILFPLVTNSWDSLNQKYVIFYIEKN